MTDGKIRM